MEEKLHRTIAIAICFMLGIISIKLTPISKINELKFLCIKLDHITNKYNLNNKRYKKEKAIIEKSILKLISTENDNNEIIACQNQIH